MLDSAKEELKKDLEPDFIETKIKSEALDSTTDSSNMEPVLQSDNDFFVKGVETNSADNFSNTGSSLGSVKEVLNKEVKLDSIKELLSSDIPLGGVKEILTQDIKLDSIKSVLNTEIPLAGVKNVLTKEIKLGNLIEMEVEIQKLKKLLATEIKLKEFLVQEIDLKKMLSSDSKKELSDEEVDVEGKSKPSEPEVKDTKVVVENTIKIPPYDHVLIETLQKEQVGILFIYKELMKYAEKRNYSQVDKRLGQFSTILKQHYAFADKELYAYLKTYIALKYPKRGKAFNELSLEMKNISIEVFFSITQSPNVPLRDETYESFMSEFFLLGEQIKNRIKREEAVLFKMYEASREVREIS